MVATEQYLKLLPTLHTLPLQSMWLTYDAEADVLYVHFQPTTSADDSELTDDDIIIRYAGDTVIGYTILHASQRSG